MIGKLFLIVFAWLTLSEIQSLAAGSDRQKLVLATMTGKAHEEVVKEVYRAFNQLNARFEVELQVYPAARAISLADIGQLDGTALRGKSLADDKYSKNLIRVPTPLVKGKLRLVVHERMMKIKDWKEGLQGSRVAVRRASPAFNGLIPDESRIEVTDDVQGLKMLRTGRVDAVAILEAAYLHLLIDNIELGQGLKLVDAAMPCPFYMFIHKDRRDLIPLLDAEIQRAAAKGGLQAAWDAVLKKYWQELDLKARRQAVQQE